MKFKSTEHKKWYKEFRAHIKKRTKEREATPMVITTMDDNSIMPFGEHKGKKLSNVPAGYLLWVYSQPWCKGELKKYIENNIDLLKQGK